MADTFGLRVPLYPREREVQPFTCCVTGATGYVAGVLVHRLLAAGHTVHGTVRDPTANAKTAHLRALPGAQERLSLYKADLMDPSSFDEAVRGCEYVFHVASPFVLNVKEDEVEKRLVGPAVQGTTSVLQAVTKAGGVKAVVLTSSVAAVYGKLDERGEGHVFTEEDWDISASPTYNPYSYSKTVAERKAWELYEQQANQPNAWRLATINPAFVMGPPLSLSPAESISFCTSMLSGKFSFIAPAIAMGWVDVEDVAAAHVLAAITPNAQGRYVCVGETGDMVSMLRRAGAKCQPPRKFVGPSPPRWVWWTLCNVFRALPWELVATSLNKELKFDTSKIKRDLGVRFKDPAESIADMAVAIEQLKKNEQVN